MIELMFGGTAAVLILLFGASARRRAARRRSEPRVYPQVTAYSPGRPHTSHGGYGYSGGGPPTRPQSEYLYRHSGGQLRDYPFHWVVK